MWCTARSCGRLFESQATSCWAWAFCGSSSFCASVTESGWPSRSMRWLPSSWRTTPMRSWCPFCSSCFFWASFVAGPCSRASSCPGCRLAMFPARPLPKPLRLATPPPPAPATIAGRQASPTKMWPTVSWTMPRGRSCAGVVPRPALRWTGASHMRSSPCFGTTPCWPPLHSASLRALWGPGSSPRRRPKVGSRSCALRW
mmetsp:Transcript_28196/g.67026  ORF Transcript_28196/g.67026 Transcript_28196/m.67026 type:complete len:200 (+) Transcript_28196:1144-1743(+)